MSERNNSNSVFVTKKILKALAFFLTVFVFMPTFLVSCSGETVEVSLMKAATGVRYDGELMEDPHLFLLIGFLIPVVILVLLFAKKYSDDLKAKVIALTVVVDFIVWIVFRTGTKQWAENNNCDFESTAWFVINMICLILMFVLSILVAKKVLDMESDVLAFIKGNSTNNNLKEISNRLSTIANNIQKTSGKSSFGYCERCGKPLTENGKFCQNCGAEVVRNNTENANNQNN